VCYINLIAPAQKSTFLLPTSLFALCLGTLAVIGTSNNGSNGNFINPLVRQGMDLATTIIDPENQQSVQDAMNREISAGQYNKSSHKGLVDNLYKSYQRNKESISKEGFNIINDIDVNSLNESGFYDFCTKPQIDNAEQAMETNLFGKPNYELEKLMNKNPKATPSQGFQKLRIICDIFDKRLDFKIDQNFIDQCKSLLSDDNENGISKENKKLLSDNLLPLLKLNANYQDAWITSMRNNREKSNELLKAFPSFNGVVLPQE
jgi:hypothetical protein